MNKKTIILIFVGILILVAVLFGIRLAGNLNKAENGQADSQVSLENGPILYYGIGCPHCDVVDEYLEKNKLTGRISFTTKEVYYNRQNAAELGQRADSCGIPSNFVGVPFLWNDGYCYIGSDEIIAFFENKLNNLNEGLNEGL